MTNIDFNDIFITQLNMVPMKLSDKTVSGWHSGESRLGAEGARLYVQSLRQKDRAFKMSTGGVFLRLFIF